MASIRPVDPKRPNGPFRIEARHTNTDGTKSRWSWTRDTMVEAQIVAGDAEKDIRAGIDCYLRYNIEPTRDEMTVGQWIAKWRVDRGIVKHHATVEKSMLDRYVIPAFGKLPMTAKGLPRLAVQQWVNRLSAEGNSPRYVRGIYGVFSKLINDAVDDATTPLDASPCVRITLPALDPTGRRALSVDEVAAICSRCGIYSAAAWTLAFTGMRIGELLARDVSDWSPFTGITIAAKIDLNAKAAGKTKAKKRAAKTPAGGRTIPLCASHGRAIRDALDGRSTGPLIRNSRKVRANYWTFNGAFGRAAEAAGLAEVTPHWLRGTLKTWLREDGCDDRAIDQVLGHRSPGMDGVYVYVTPVMLKQITDALEIRWLSAHASSRLAKASGE